MGLLRSVFVLLLSFSIFSDRRSLKIENENNSMKTKKRTFDHRSLIYGIIGTQERVLNRQGKRAINARAIKVLRYLFYFHLIVPEVKGTCP